MNIEIEKSEIPAVVIFTTKKLGDDRGFFSEVYSKKSLGARGFYFEFVQDNHSFSIEKGTVRGLHFQRPPFAQDKLVRVVRGAILDVAVDLRQGSPTFGKHVTALISAASWNQILVPIGFAHGFCTLEPNTEVIYKVSDYFSSEYDSGVLWNDPALGIDWPVSETEAILSSKDRALPGLAEHEHCFIFDTTDQPY